VTHYEQLGIRPTASATEIRAAYRAAARRAHPDRHGDSSSARMASINEAYRVLSDPDRRNRYDAELRSSSASSSSSSSSSSATSASSSAAHTSSAAARVVVPEMHTPARFPWRFMLGLASVGIAIVILGVILYEPATPPPVDNILRPGDCVTLSPALEAVETTCDGPYDAVVHALVPIDERCATGTEPYRDRQGMGMACVVRHVAGATSAARDRAVSHRWR